MLPHPSRIEQHEPKQSSVYNKLFVSEWTQILDASSNSDNIRLQLQTEFLYSVFFFHLLKKENWNAKHVFDMRQEHMFITSQSRYYLKKPKWCSVRWNCNFLISKKNVVLGLCFIVPISSKFGKFSQIFEFHKN